MAAIYGLTTFAIAVIAGVIFLKLLAPRLDEEKWTLGRQIVWRLCLLVLVALANTWVFQVAENATLTLSSYLTMLSYVVLMGIFPITIVELIAYNRYLRQNVTAAHRLSGLLDANLEPEVHENEITPALNADLEIAALPAMPAVHHETGEETLLKDQIRLRGENANESLLLQAGQLLALQSVDNYVTVYFLKDGGVKSVMLRNTLTNMAEQLEHYHCLFRTHRAYLVNMHHILYVSGNAQGYKLDIKGLEKKIPVSRGNIQAFRELAEKYLSREKEAVAA